MNEKQAVALIARKIKKGYPSLQDAADDILIDYSLLAGILRGKRKLTADLAEWAGLKVNKKITYSYEVMQ